MALLGILTHSCLSIVRCGFAAFNSQQQQQTAETVREGLPAEILLEQSVGFGLRSASSAASRRWLIRKHSHSCIRFARVNLPASRAIVCSPPRFISVQFYLSLCVEFSFAVCAVNRCCCRRRRQSGSGGNDAAATNAAAAAAAVVVVAMYVCIWPARHSEQPRRI